MKNRVVASLAVLLLLVGCEPITMKSELVKTVQSYVNQQTLPTAKAPKFSPDPAAVTGDFTTDQAVVLSSEETSAEIRYTLDDTAPTETSTKYTTPIAVAADGTSIKIRAIVVLAGYNNSPEAAKTYTINYPSGTVSTVAGGGSVGGNAAGYQNGSRTAALFDAPESLVVDSVGNIFVNDLGNRVIRKIATDGTVSLFYGAPKTTSSFATTADWPLYSPRQMAIDSSDNLYVVDYNQHKLKKISSAGVETDVVSSGLNFPTGLTITPSGAIYISDQSGQILLVSGSSVATVNQYGGPYTGMAKSLASFTGTFPFLLAWSDPSSTEKVVKARLDSWNSSVYVSSPNSSAFDGSSSGGVAVDSTGVLYMGTNTKNTILKATPDSSGPLLAVTPAIFAGTGTSGFVDGPKGTALFNKPRGLFVTAAGDIYVADSGNNVIRKIKH